ncbi:MAG: hypothetical protein BWY79_00799 [Actinobacteria bacterium ADurb.Bin444]|nr:MAG: hypothetical protein BWY79_00799 [Actinobacteria bacterium ADurb.Bin444]
MRWNHHARDQFAGLQCQPRNAIVTVDISQCRLPLHNSRTIPASQADTSSQRNKCGRGIRSKDGVAPARTRHSQTHIAALLKTRLGCAPPPRSPIVKRATGVQAQIAAHGTLVSQLRTTHRFSGGCERRKLRSYPRMGCHIGQPRAGTQVDAGSAAIDLVPIGDTLQIHEARRLQQPQLESGDQTSPPGERHGAFEFVEQTNRLLNTARSLDGAIW